MQCDDFRLVNLMNGGDNVFNCVCVCVCVSFCLSVCVCMQWPDVTLLMNSTVTESPFALLFQTLYFSITFK